MSLTLPALFLLACTASPQASDTGDPLLQLHPTLAGQGTRLTLYMDASRWTFSYGQTLLDLGEGIAVTQLDVDDGYGLRAALEVDADAPLGPRDVTVEIEGRTTVLPSAFQVIAESFTLTPDRAAMGEAVAVDFAGNGTDWVSGSTWPAFGSGVDVVEFTVLGPDQATGLVVVDPTAEPGRRDVAMQGSGGTQLLSPEAFLVDRVGVAGALSPGSALPGDTLSFRVEARGTDFLEGLPALDFRDAYGVTADVVVDSVTVVDANSLVGQLTVSNAARPGVLDLQVLSGDRGVLLVDAFEVLPGGWSIDDVAIDLRLHVDRAIDNSSGVVDESVTAYCRFYLPLDPDCPSDDVVGESLGSPSPYDVDEAFAVPGQKLPDDSDCPFERTVGAGDRVWLESDDNIITLDRVEDDASDTVYYIARDLPLADYVVDNVYDLRIDGEDGGLDPHLLEGVQPTVPADWSLLSPDLWGNHTHNRAQDLCLTWTPAQTYPDASFIATLFTRSSPGPLVEDGYVGYVGVVPWDDGEHCIDASALSVLAPGTVPVIIYSYDEGPAFGLPGSQYQQNEARTWIALRASLVLE